MSVVHGSHPAGGRRRPRRRAAEDRARGTARGRSSWAWRSSARSCALLAYIPPFTLAQPSNAWIDGFTNAGVFVMLALGLNLVVGVAGLLDLGYAAFFAIGAYTYAYVASPFGNSIIGIPIVESLGTDAGGLLFWPMLLVGALVAATFGILLGAPTLRLRGDYLAIVTLGFGEIVPIVFLNSDAVTNGTNGIGGLLRPALPGIGSLLRHQPVALLRHDAGARHRHHDPVLPARGEPARPGLGGHPRGRAGGGRQRHQHRHHQAARLRARRVHRGHRRRVQRLEARHRRARTSSRSSCRSRCSRWSSSAAWATSGASPSARS